jgi:hypothetical protein
MIARLLTLIVIVTLALPITPLTPLGDPGQGPWSDIIMEAKGKKPKKNTKKHNTQTDTTPVTVPQFTTVARTVRQEVTQTFTSPQPITIPAGAPSSTIGPAGPYPAVIDVSGFANGVITDVNLTLHDFGHTKPQDVDIMLVAEQLTSRNALVMSDVGSTNEVVGLTLTLDDQAGEPLSVNGPLVSGRFQPNDNDLEVTLDAFPGQTPSGNTRLSHFNGGNPNGSWQLLVVDDRVAGTGKIVGGWSLQITAEADVQVQEQVQITGEEPRSTDSDTKTPKAKKKGKKRKK